MLAEFNLPNTCLIAKQEITLIVKKKLSKKGINSLGKKSNPSDFNPTVMTVEYLALMVKDMKPKKSKLKSVIKKFLPSLEIK